MITCTFCRSNDVRRSSSSKLDPLAIRLRRALSFVRLYRCRSCDGLFEAMLLGSIWTHVNPSKRSNQPKNGNARAGSEGLHREIGSSGLDASE